MVRYSSVQAFSDQNTKTVSGYKEGPTGGEGSKPHKIEKASNLVMGSCAGAGSEQFHIYRASRRREMDRIDGMERDSITEEAERVFAEKIDRNKREADDKTKKNAEKRKRKKMKKGGAKKMSSGVKASDDEDDEDSEAEGSEEIASKAMVPKATEPVTVIVTDRIKVVRQMKIIDDEL